MIDCKREEHIDLMTGEENLLIIRSPWKNMFHVIYQDIHSDITDYQLRHVDDIERMTLDLSTNDTWLEFKR